MFETPMNLKSISMKLTRSEVNDLILALTAISENLNNLEMSHTKWDCLRSKLEEIRNDFDTKQMGGRKG